MQKKLTMMLSLLLALALLAACGTTASPSSSAPPASSAAPESAPPAAGSEAPSEAAVSPDKPYDGETIRLVTPNQPCVEVTMQEALDEFYELTGITVEMEILGTDQFTNKVTVELSAQNKGLDLIFLRPLNDLKLFNQNGWLTELTPFFEGDEEFDLGDFFEGSINSCTYDGGLYGIPFVAESQLVYYRKDIFEEKNLTFPETMDEFYETALALTDKANDFYGYVGRGKTNQVVTQFSTFLRSFGGDFNTPTESLVNSPGAIAAYNFYGKLLHDCGPPGVTNMSWPEAAALFAQGKAAMFADADAIYANVTDKENSDVSDVTGFALMPAGPAGRKPFYAVAGAFSIPTFSEKKGAAAEFIRWACGKEMDVRSMIDVKNPGCRESSWANAEATAGWPPELLEVMQASRAVAVAGDRPTVINVVEARDIISVPIIEAIQGNDPTQAANKAHEEFQALIDRENSGG